MLSFLKGKGTKMVGNFLQVLFYSQLFSLFSIAALLAPPALVTLCIGIIITMIIIIKITISLISISWLYIHLADHSS